jgi:hypothetical protein
MFNILNYGGLPMSARKSGGVHHPFISGGLGCNDSAASHTGRRKRTRIYKKCSV